ncbi:dnaJ homolog subfamily C member 15 isoform X2 [Callorhinus ursinus]|uniref:dnaJ homolog subfamily C member 15 isoform X2 n=1 Tax=Callorhinus ursinus TaxID=34884 RepID=UPI003CD0234E
MAARGGVAAAGEGLRYAEYSPPATNRPDADVDQGLARSLIAVGLGVAALAFAGRYAFQIWKPLEQVITETAKKISTPSFSSYYKGGFEQKMSRREASLILGIRERHSESRNTSRGSGRGRNRLPAEQRARRGTRSQDPGIMT